MLYYCILGLFSNCSPQSQARWPNASRHNIKSGTRNDLPDEIFVVIIVVIIIIRSLFNGQLQPGRIFVGVNSTLVTNLTYVLYPAANEKTGRTYSYTNY